MLGVWGWRRCCSGCGAEEGVGQRREKSVDEMGREEKGKKGGLGRDIF